MLLAGGLAFGALMLPGVGPFRTASDPTTSVHFQEPPEVPTSVRRDGRIRISEGGGFSPRWRGDGRELFYLTPDGSVMTIEMDAKRELGPGAAKRLFRVPGVIPEWGVTQDGTRFLFAVPVSQPPPFNVVQDWQATLPK